jgi:hypothetical protein
MNRRLAWIDQAGLAVLAGVATTLLIGDFGVRLANTSTDDGLVAIAYFFKYPELFAQDRQLGGWAPVALASMLNWLPAIAFKYAGLPPEVFYWLFTYLQNILLATAMYRLAVATVQSREVALISAVFALAFRPHWWNAGLFGDLDWMPYGAWMALPFLVYAGAFAFERRLRITAAMLLVGGLIHPVLGLFASAMVATFWFLSLMLEGRLDRLVAPMAVLGAVSVTFALPVVLARAGLEQAGDSQVLAVVLKNGHAIPWANPGCSYCMPLFVKSLVAVPAVAALALTAAWHGASHPRLRLFLLACVLVALGACLLHVLAYFAGNATVLPLVSTRSTILLLAFAVPPAVSLGWRVLTTAPSPVSRFFACYVMTLPMPAALVAGMLGLAGPAKAAGLALLSLLLARAIPGAGGWIDANVIGRFMDTALVPVLLGPSGTRVQIFFIAVSALLAWRAGRRKVERPIGALVIALVAPLIIYLLVSNYQAGRTSTSGEARDYYEVQAWARSSTPAEATFIVWQTSVYEGWRNFTHRARVSQPGCSFYLCSKASVAEGEKAKEFFAQHGNAGYAGLDTKGLKAFARVYGGDYVVRRKSWPKVDLPIAYENRAYVVHDLRQSR